MSFIAAFALVLLALIAVFTAAWAVQLRTRNAGMIDPVWALSLGGVAVLVAVVAPGDALNRLFVAVCGGAWGWRLGWHLWRRNHGQPEDYRYRALRERWGASAAWRMLAFFLLQAVVSILLAIAFFVPAYQADPPSRFAMAIALAIWIASVAGEAAADRQLRRFVARPDRRGQVCDAGWWRYSRHPNYFFECLHWCAYAAWALGRPWGWATLAPPLLMAWLLLKVSGIPLLEEHLVRSRAGYREYRRRTSALIPWPPRRPSTASSTDPGEPRP
ncbi:DUF1295 domain-containing protein [Burkholderia gladioli]|uniref:DUF1295 domain-containing protein n=1 Tax=Burkholderia gladioli TaxID=28095 RepID=UPI003F790BE9